MSRSSSLIPLSVPIRFPKKTSTNSKNTHNNAASKRSARSESLVFAIFLTSNPAFIKSVYRNPPTYDSGRKSCHVLCIHTDRRDAAQYEQACVSVLESGRFRRVQLYTDLVVDADHMALQQRLLILCSRLHIHVDVTTTPNLENLTSPRTCLIRKCVDEEEQEDKSQELLSRDQLLQRMDHICEKMSTLLRAKLLLSGGEPPEDMGTIFAFHDCWKQMYELVRWEEGLSHTAQEELEKRQLYYVEQGDFYDDIPL